MMKSDDSHKIVTTIIALARNLGMTTVAEGVEEYSQAERLRALGCDSAQGFYFARPMAAKEAEAFINKGVCGPSGESSGEQSIDAQSVERASPAKGCSDALNAMCELNVWLTKRTRLDWA